MVNDFTSADRLDAILAEVAEGLSAQAPGGERNDAVWRLIHGTRTRRLGSLAARSDQFVELLLDERLAGYSRLTLGDLASDVVLNTAQLISIGPGERAQPLHRDAASWIHLLGSGRDVMVGCMIACGEFTKQNGATRVVAGSHRDEKLDVLPPESHAIPVEMGKGAALFYTGRVLHGGGANTTEKEWRTGLHLSFCLGWLRPEEHHALAVPVDRARALPARARQLLGYSTYTPPPNTPGGRLGLVDGEDVDGILEVIP